MKPRIKNWAVEHSDSFHNNTVQHWGFFTPEEIKTANQNGQLLMLDIDFGRDCSLHCPGCFRRQNLVDNGQPDLGYDELLDTLHQAKDLGLRSVKICGAGEPLENPRLLDLARNLTEMDIGLAIFTKGNILGDEVLCQEIHGLTPKDVCEELFSLKTSVMLSYPTFDKEMLRKLVGGSVNYPDKLKIAAELLALTGFNSTSPTRLAFVHAPVTKQSIGRAHEMYEFARNHNILPILAFHMISGEQINSRFLKKYDASTEDKLNLFKWAYRYNFEHGIQTPAEILHEGISCMPGVYPCNQIAVGLYITANGNVIRCPGDKGGNILGNVRDGLRNIWTKSRDWEFCGIHNCGCPYKDGTTIPWEIYGQLYQYIRSFTR
ncbi:MAG: radical SAM protein [Candidatus Magasanikbacteria bacterium]